MPVATSRIALARCDGVAFSHGVLLLARMARQPNLTYPRSPRRWRRGTAEPPKDLDTAVQLFPVSPQVNSPKYDAEDCIAALA